MTDENILQLFIQRDESAIKETDKKYGSYCFQIANHILANKEDSEECVNDTWLKAWNTIPPAKPTHFRLYLAKIIRNLSFNKYKEKHTQKRGKGELSCVLDELQECIADKTDVEDSYLAKELQAAINQFVRGLPEREGNIFIRRYFFAEPVKDISSRYHISENHVRVILNRTRNKLKANLQKEGYLV